MFNSLSSFFWFFIIGLTLVIVGICFEEKLVAFEHWIGNRIWNWIHGKHTKHPQVNTTENEVDLFPEVEEDMAAMFDGIIFEWER